MPRDMKRCHLLVSVVLFFATLVFLPDAGLAAEYYVDQSHPSASDTNPGTESLPWATLYAINTATLAPGDIVYVKAGTYLINTGGSWTTPAVAPAQAGAPDSPITVAAYPGHTVILDGGGNQSNSVIGARRSYTVIRGFLIVNAGGWGLNAGGSSNQRLFGVVFERNDCSGITAPDSTNPGCIRLNWTDGAVVQDNYIHNDPLSIDGPGVNTSGIFLEHNRNARIIHNEIYHFRTGSFDKYGGQDNEIAYNYVHDVYMGIIASCFGAETHPCGGGWWHHNVVAFSGNEGITIGNSATTTSFPSYQVTQNTLWSIAQSGIMTGSNALVVRDNIVGAASTARGALIFGTLGETDWNNYYPRQRWIENEYQPTQQIWSSLETWRTTGRDANGFAVDPLFVGPLSATSPVTAYQLGAASPLRGRGSEGGHIGAHDTDTRVIGIRPADPLAPAAPINLLVQ